MGKNQSLILPHPLILASTSKYRGELMKQLGWPFEALSPGVDEDQFKNNSYSPAELAKLLSEEKARAVFLKRQEACVIGSDQVCTLEGKILSKPGTVDKACEQLLHMRGKTHELLTAVTVMYPGGKETFLNVTKLSMRNMTTQQIRSYVEADLPLDCAGSYKLESKGIKLFTKIDMTDQTAIIGLPLIELTSVLLKLGYPL